MVFSFNLNAHAQAYPKLNSDFDINSKPKPAPIMWIGILGEYIFDGQTILIREQAGALHIIMDQNNDPLTQIDFNNFSYKNQNGINNLSFMRDADGNGISLKNNDDIYARNHIEPRNGETFKVDLKKDVDIYINAALKETPPVEQGDFVPSDLVDVTKYIDNVKLDVRYAGQNNFLGVATYSKAKTFLQRPAAIAISKANEKLADLGYGLLMHDGYRPWYVTKVFWDATSGDERNFVADPKKGSKHNRGCAIDLTLYELESGKIIKMVGTYDEMSIRSYPDYKGGTSLERWHRDLLRSVMEDAGFNVNSLEWWHFDYKDWQKYPILNETFDELTLKN